MSTYEVLVRGRGEQMHVVEAADRAEAEELVRERVARNLFCEVFERNGGSRLDRVDADIAGVLDILNEHATALRELKDASTEMDERVSGVEDAVFHTDAAEPKPGVWRRIAEWAEAAWRNETVRRIGAAVGAWIAKMAAGLFRRGK